MFVVRFECKGTVVREARDWEGPAPEAGDTVTLTLNPNTSPRSPGVYLPGKYATFVVKSRRFIREETEHRTTHTILFQVEPI